MVTSTEFLQQIRDVWQTRLLKSASAKRLATWCLEYFDEYGKCPEKTIVDIVHDKIRIGEVPKDEQEALEDLLENLDDEYDESFNVKYVLDKTFVYLEERHLELHNEKLKELTDGGNYDDAKTLASSYTGLSAPNLDDVDLSDPKALLRIENVFTALADPLITYPGAAGNLLNNHLTRGAFVAFMASEKRGKSFWLLDMAIRASQKRMKVAFFQAGDMTENQQLQRLCSYLAKKPVLEKYTGDVYIPVVDCIYNQLDSCDKEERACDFGPFSNSEWDIETLRDEVTREAQLEVFEDNWDYQPCRNCEEFKTRSFGIPWIKKENVPGILTEDDAKKKIESFFIKKKRRFRISTHINDSLSVSTIRQILDRWESTDGFIPDLIIVDYADLLVPSKSMEFRHQQNQIWKELRALNQEKNCLLVTATQADAQSYKQDTLNLSNFSEDKRKYAHVTAMFGLNQDKYGREKQLGVLRINELVIRQGGTDTNSVAHVLQVLSLSRPFLGSYY